MAATKHAALCPRTSAGTNVTLTRSQLFAKKTNFSALVSRCRAGARLRPTGDAVKGIERWHRNEAVSNEAVSNKAVDEDLLRLVWEGGRAGRRLADAGCLLESVGVCQEPVLCIVEPEQFGAHRNAKRRGGARR